MNLDSVTDVAAKAPNLRQSDTNLMEAVRVTKEQGAMQGKLLNGMVRSVGDVRTEVKNTSSLVQELLVVVRDMRDNCVKVIDAMSPSPREARRKSRARSEHGDDDDEEVWQVGTASMHANTTTTSAGLESVAEERQALHRGSMRSLNGDFAAIIKAIEQSRPVLDYAPLMDDLRQDFLAMLQGIRESTSFVMAGQDAHFGNILAVMEESRRSSEESCMALYQAIRESKQDPFFNGINGINGLNHYNTLLEEQKDAKDGGQLGLQILHGINGETALGPPVVGKMKGGA